MEMDIASLSTSMHTASLATQVSTAVMNLAMDSAKTESSSMIQLMESADPNVGKNLDILV